MHDVVVDRLFVAAWPDAETTDALRELPRPDERGVRWLPPAQWHVTLRFVGSCDPEAVMARLDGATLPRSEARLGPAVEWLGPQLVVPVTGVDDLASAVHAVTAGIGEPPRRRFHGHLTIARTRQGASSVVLGHPVRASFTVHEVALVRSQLTSDGPLYTTVATYPAT